MYTTEELILNENIFHTKQVTSYRKPAIVKDVAIYIKIGVRRSGLVLSGVAEGGVYSGECQI